MFLFPKPKTYKGKTYTYYCIAESYRDDKGRSQKKEFFRLGKLSDSQAEMIRKVLALKNDESSFVTTLDDLLFKDQWAFLDVASIDKLWHKWYLSSIFEETERKVPAREIVSPSETKLT